MRTAFLLAVVVATLGCHDSTGPSTPPGPVSGHWTGTAPDYAPLDFKVTQTDTLITGSGKMSGTSPQPIELIGFYSSDGSADPVVMTISAENAVPAVFFGHLSSNGNVLIGTLTISFINTTDSITFTRQP